jgi:hypothetical protein
VVHALTEVHDTTPEECGALMLDQRLPFQRSATAFFPSSPRATHALADGQDTPKSAPLPGPSGRWTDHRLPFQRSISWLP